MTDRHAKALIIAMLVLGFLVMMAQGKI